MSFDESRLELESCRCGVLPSWVSSLRSQHSTLTMTERLSCSSRIVVKHERNS
ncbi:unnamed protein product [Linum tenue]|uniref:Uncharacterized protein n=1 Tax=Linum tenue TaxID=586396 RepID=A0AAV0HY48_9ROSI|nr:unnamed protein product [Linum tenue]